MLNWFKKKKVKEVEIKNSIVQAQVGDVVDYYMKSWEVKEEGEYDWGNNEFSTEIKLDAGDEIIYLTIDEDDETELSVSKPAKWNEVEGDLRSHLLQYNEPPRELISAGVRYKLTENGFGRYRSISKDTDWSSFEFWDFEDETEDKLITVESWGGEFELFKGEYVETFEFSIFGRES